MLRADRNPKRFSRLFRKFFPKSEVYLIIALRLLIINTFIQKQHSQCNANVPELGIIH